LLFSANFVSLPPSSLSGAVDAFGIRLGVSQLLGGLIAITFTGDEPRLGLAPQIAEDAL